MKSIFFRLLAVFILFRLSGPAALSQTTPEPQDNFTLSTYPPTPGSYKLAAPGKTGRVYFFQMSADQQNWAYASTVQLGSTGTPQEYFFTPLAGQKYFFRLKYTVETTYTAGATGDIDRDGLSNAAELTAYTDPFDPDTDSDGMPDGWEVQYSLDPLSSADAALDSETGGGDTLTNLQEYQLGTDPKKKDTDDDGLDDNVEVNAGGDPTRFNMPEFTLVSATRQAVLRETIERPAGMTAFREAQSTANGRGTSAGIHASRTFQLASPGTSTTFTPWSMNSAATSAWAMGTGIPAPVVPVETHDMATPLFASRKEMMHGDGDFIAVPGLSNAEEYRNITRDGAIVERTVRVKAARAMPVVWSIPYTRSTVSKSLRNGAWMAPPVSTGTFTFAAGQTYSDAVTMDLSTTGATGGTVAAKPGRKRANASAPWTNSLFTSAEAVEWLTIDKIDSASTNLNTDTDRDGVPNTLEAKMGTVTTMRNSDGSDYADGDQLNRNVLPPAETFLITTRRSEYEFNPEDPKCPYHPAHRLATETDTPYQSDFDDALATATGLGDPFHARLASGAAFPSSPPASANMPLLSDDGTAAAAISPVASMGYTSNPSAGIEAADGRQVQVWAKIAEPLSGNATFDYLKVRKVETTGQPATFTATPVSMTIPAGSVTSSEPTTLLAKLPSGSTAQNSVITEYLFVGGLRMIHPASGALGEDKENSEDGGYVPIKRDASTPVTRLNIYTYSEDPTIHAGKFRLKFDAGTRYKLYKDAARTITVQSEVTEFTGADLPGGKIDLYFEGLKKSLSRGGEKVTVQLQPYSGSTWRDRDDLIFTIVQSEFLFQVKAFIPYAWTESEEVPGPDEYLNPMYGKVAKGDLYPGLGLRGSAPGFRNVFSTELPAAEFTKAPFRVCQTVIVTPYPDLHSAVDVKAKRELVTAPLSEHFFKTAVHASETSLHMGFLTLDPAGFSKDGKPPKNQALYENGSRTGGIAELTVDGGGKDGAMPKGTTWASRDIHWRLNLKVKTSANPLQPEVEFGGQHDRYPAYEIIVNQSDGTFTDVHRFSPAPGERPGLNSLYDGAGPHVSGTKTISQ